jgi:hypothetical protein
MLTIRDHCISQAVGMDAGRLKSMLAVAEIHAAVKENFVDHPDGGHTCKLCGEHVNHPRAAAAHLAVHHAKALQSGGPGSGPRPHDEVLQQYGYEESGKARTGSMMYNHSKDSNDRVLVADNGSWRHINKGSGAKASVGNGADTLRQHLSSIHDRGKAAFGKAINRL